MFLMTSSCRMGHCDLLFLKGHGVANAESKQTIQGEIVLVVTIAVFAYLFI